MSECGVKVDPEKVRAVERMKEPSSLRDSRALLGLVGYYRKFIPGFGKAAETLYSLLNKLNKLEWSTECENAVTELKKAFGYPVLGHPSDRDPCPLTTDASLTGIGAFLTQKIGTEDRVIASASETLSKSQRNYSATKKELFEIVHFTQHFKNYLLGQHF